MQFVECPIHPYSDVQVVQSTVLPNLVHHRSHPRAADLGSPAGHRAAHLLHDDGVIACAVQPQLLKNGSYLEQGQPVTGDTFRERSNCHH